MTNADIARVLSRIATLLEIDGANPFRVRAYRESARVVDTNPESMATLAATEGALEELPGIGKDLAGKIAELVKTGTIPMYEELKKKIPEEVATFTELQGLGPKRVKTLFETMHITTREQLEAAAKAGKLRDLPGFGEKVEQNVIKALATASATTGRMLLAAAWPVAHAIADHVRRVPGVQQVELAGSFRRRKETVGDLDVLVTGGHVDRVMEAFIHQSDVIDVLGRGETKSSVRLRNGLQVDLRHVPPESFGAALLYFTGSKEHNIELRKIAIERGLSLNEYGLTRGQRMEAGRTEEEVYAALGLKWIPPELREMHGEIEMARFYELPRLIEEADLVADLHMHSTRTDGRDTLEQMVQAARDRGYAYCAITEHSQSVTMVGGFNEERVRQSIGEIAAVRKAVPGIEVLHGLEVDILADGTLDLDDDALALLDWVIVSLHSRLDQPADVMTARVLKALDHPLVCAMAHPTARMIGTREPAAFDRERVFERAAARGVAMEINSQPDRTDLSDVNARAAKEKGVSFVIDTDAHSRTQLEFIRYGVFAARRAGLTREDVLNTQPFARFSERFPRGRGAGAPVSIAVPVMAGAEAEIVPALAPAHALTIEREPVLRTPELAPTIEREIRPAVVAPEPRPAPIAQKPRQKAPPLLVKPRAKQAPVAAKSPAKKSPAPKPTPKPTPRSPKSAAKPKTTRRPAAKSGASRTRKSK